MAAERLLRDGELGWHGWVVVVFFAGERRERTVPQVGTGNNRKHKHGPRGERWRGRKEERFES